MNNHAVNTIFRDVLINYIGYLVVFLVVALVVVVNSDKKAKDINVGNMLVTIAWPKGNVDVDLWLLAPGEPPVGYTSKSGKTWNLLRDDTGLANDILEENFENAFSRGNPPGDYVIDIHCYSCSGPVEVKAILEKKVKNSNRLETVAEKKVTLRGRNDQRTLWAFHVNPDGVIDHMSEVEIPILERKFQDAPAVPTPTPILPPGG